MSSSQQHCACVARARERASQRARCVKNTPAKFARLLMSSSCLPRRVGLKSSDATQPSPAQPSPAQLNFGQNNDNNSNRAARAGASAQFAMELGRAGALICTAAFLSVSWLCSLSLSLSLSLEPRAQFAITHCEQHSPRELACKTPPKFAWKLPFAKSTCDRQHRKGPKRHASPPLLPEARAKTHSHTHTHTHTHRASAIGNWIQLAGSAQVHPSSWLARRRTGFNCVSRWPIK